MIAASPWEMNPRRLNRRRFLFFSAIFFLTSLATWFMADLLWRDGITFLAGTLLVLFVILFGHVAAGFCTAAVGFYVVNRGGDGSRINATLPPDGNPELGPTAVVLPICNEEVGRVFAGLREIYHSVAATGRMEHFDFFILSDSTVPDRWVEEEIAWTQFCREEGGLGRVFYRKRRQSINKKAGNVADFLRRWGKKYRYMIVLDADSLMTGPALVRLVALMEKNPHTGIIQTAPRLIRAETLYARIQAFANRLYSPLYLAGINYWQQHDGNYWGHNAVIRVQPFMEHCALPALPGREPIGGNILSHDFVEAALMRRAGWAVWLAHDVEGSFEETPPTLIDNARRDRRWCQGNMQHAWLLSARGFRLANRFHFFMGLMGYVSSPLWLLFLILGFGQALEEDQADRLGKFRAPDTTSLFGYQVNVPEALTLFALTLCLIFLPRLMSVAATLRDPELLRRFGGKVRLIGSAILESLASALLAPISMFFNSRFVVFTLLGQGVTWASQNRQSDADGTDWRGAILTHWVQTAFGVVWGVSSWILVPDYFWWLTPVLAGLVFSVPISILSSQVRLGRASRRRGLFLTPEEVDPPAEVLGLERALAAARPHDPFPFAALDGGFLRAVLDPYVNALHVALLRERRPTDEAREWLGDLGQRLLREGPAGIARREQLALLLDAESMIWLHRELWRSPAGSLAEWWRVAMRRYRLIPPEPAGAAAESGVSKS